jgi:hypothetical protein
MLPSVPRWYSKHVHVLVGSALEDAMPCGERSGRVASSVSRLYMRILDWPPMRRCFFAPWAESGMVMKETWESVRALDALLYGMLALVLRRLEDGYVQPCPNVYIAAGDLVRANKEVATVTACAINPDRVLARVRLRGVEGDFAALVAVGSVCGPRSLIPSVLEPLRYLSNGERGNRKREKGCLSKHDD